MWALCWHNSQRRREMLVNLLKAKTRTSISTKCLLFKWINRVCRIDGFSWNLARTLPKQWGTKSNNSFVAASQSNTFPILLMLELDRSIKRKPIGIRENPHTLWEIDALWLPLCSYISSAITFDTRLIRLDGVRSFYCLLASFALSQG